MLKTTDGIPLTLFTKTLNHIQKVSLFHKSIKLECTMLKRMCRVCGRYAANKKSLSLFDNENLLWSIQVLTGLILEKANCLPNLICICCQTELREAIRFSDRVIVAQQQLLSALTEEELQELSEEYKVAVMEFGNGTQKANNINNSEAQSEFITLSDNGEGKDVIIKTQLVEADDVVIDEDGQKDNFMEYEINIDDHEAEIRDSQSCEKIEYFADEQESPIIGGIHDNKAPDDYILPDKDSEEECALLDRVLNDEIATQNVAKKKRGRKRLGNLIFVCEECGNHISGRMAFELHCRRHRGDKQFECDICQDRFCTSSELKRHMRRHTGERPFACQYCGRCFTDYSTRLKHERTHTNERPYVCTNCGKAFTTAYILKNHMLIHSGERAFSCELCNKSFIRQTHLSTHFRSSAHKRNQERHNKERSES